MKRYALLLAADRYRDPGIQRLRYAERDARVLEGFLRERARFDHVEEFYGEALTKNAALDAAERLAEELVATGGGLLLMFYAGHGFTHQNRHCLLTPGAGLRDLDDFDHAVTVDKLKRVTARPRVERQLVVDACRSNLRVGERQMTEGYSATGLRNVVGAAPEPQAGGWSVLASCDEGEQASEVETLRHGVFAWAWLEELRTAQRDGREVRLDERLVERLRTRVAEVGRQHGLDRSQRPWVQSNAIPPVILGGTPGAIRPAVSPALPTAEPAPAPAPGGSVLVRLREEVQRRAAAFEELYPAYDELRRDRHTRPAELVEAWSDLCASCGITVIPATPGDLEWHEDGVRVVTRPVAPPPPKGATATKSQPFTNSLGMKFVPVVTRLDGKNRPTSDRKARSIPTSHAARCGTTPRAASRGEYQSPSPPYWRAAGGAIKGASGVAKS
jgi:uncharacterized caspase-like protein